MGRGKRQQRKGAFPNQATQATSSFRHLPDDVEAAPRGVPQSVDWPRGVRRWYVDGLLQRDDGPAAEHPEYVRWYRSGRLHRDDGPAVVWLNEESRGWFRNGRLHRDDGPAIESPDGDDRWFKNGVEQPVPEAPSMTPPGRIARPSSLARP
jgi:hypothetical protein